MHRFKICIYMLITLVLGCDLSEALYSSDKWQVYEGAYDVQMYELEDDNASQLSFKVDLPYPNSDVLQYYVAHYQDNGWLLCRTGAEDHDSWTSLRETKESKVYEIKQAAFYLLSADRNALLLVVLRYYSRDGASKKDSNRGPQHVTLVQYNKEIEDLLSSLLLVCQ